MKTLYEAIEGQDYSNVNLDLRDSEITRLPANLIVRGDLDISYANITELPKGLEVVSEIIGFKS